MEIDIIGAPLDFGAGRRGVDMGPSAIRYAGLKRGLEALGHDVRDLGNVSVPLGENCPPGDPKLKYLDPIIEVEHQLVEVVSSTVEEGRIPLVLGGDHSLALGSVIGATKDGRKLGLIWLDTHGDFNTDQTTPSGNIHGMPLAALLGYGNERLVTLDGLVGSEPKIEDRKSTRLNSSHVAISYAVFCLKKKKKLTYNYDTCKQQDVDTPDNS